MSRTFVHKVTFVCDICGASFERDAPAENMVIVDEPVVERAVYCGEPNLRRSLEPLWKGDACRPCEHKLVARLRNTVDAIILGIKEEDGSEAEPEPARTAQMVFAAPLTPEEEEALIAGASRPGAIVRVHPGSVMQRTAARNRDGSPYESAGQAPDGSLSSQMANPASPLRLRLPDGDDIPF